MNLFYDTETTGMWNNKLPMGHEDQPKIVQLAAILAYPNGEEAMGINLIVRQDFVPDAAAAIHGKTTDIVQKLGLPETIALTVFEEMVAVADNMVAHNGEYDSKVVQNAINLIDGPNAKDFFAGKKQFCTMKASTAICKIKGPRGFKWPKLQEAHTILTGVPFDGAHDALADVRACKTVYHRLCEIIAERQAAAA